MMRAALGLIFITIATPAVGQITTRYAYDALGRLIGSGNQGGSINGNTIRIVYDTADNRKSYQSFNTFVELSSGQQITSPDGRFRLVQQGDGNLVLYFGAQALWNSAVFGSNHTTYFQSDGNLVTYSATGPVWNSATSGIGARLALQNDGNLVIYDIDDKVLWTTNTGGH